MQGKNIRGNDTFYRSSEILLQGKNNETEKQDTKPMKTSFIKDTCNQLPMDSETT